MGSFQVSLKCRSRDVELMKNCHLERKHTSHPCMQVECGEGSDSLISSCCHISRGASDSMAGSWSMGSVAGLRKHSRVGEYSSSTTLNSFCSVTIFSCTAGRASIGWGEDKNK